MAENSQIQWTFNPWRGCQEFARTRIMLAESGWQNPVRWQKLARQERTLWHMITDRPGMKLAEIKTLLEDARVPAWINSMLRRGVIATDAAGGHIALDWQAPRVFCASLADVFEDWDGPMHDHKNAEMRIDSRALTQRDVRSRLFRLIDKTPDLDWLLLTKRPENIRRMWCQLSEVPVSELGKPAHRANVWLGTSVEDQDQAAQRIPELLKCRDLSPILFLSCEPLLGPVDLQMGEKQSPVDWVIGGGESGTHARPCDIAWLRSLRDQCKAAGIAYYLKQLGAVPFEDDSGILGAPIDSASFTRLPTANMKHPKGGDIAEWPEDLQVREFPKR